MINHYWAGETHQFSIGFRLTNGMSIGRSVLDVVSRKSLKNHVEWSFFEDDHLYLSANYLVIFAAV